jgi:DNA-directed RNA polymerase specialized sigma24 family protein
MVWWWAPEMMPGELRGLVERCRTEEALAWEHFAAWVKRRGWVVLRGVGGLVRADGEDAVADALKSLVAAVRRGRIRGVSNAEIDAYVCAAVRHRALNLVRGRARRSVGEGATNSLGHSARDRGPGREAADETSGQDARAVAAELLARAEHLLLTWPAADRYLFLAKLNGVPAKVIQATLERPPFLSFAAVTTVDARFHRLRKRLIAYVLGE